MKRSIFNLIILTVILGLTSCITSVSEIPQKFEDSEYTWNEISKDAAQTLWSTFPSGKQHNKATVYELYTANKIRKTEHCSVKLESGNYTVSVMSNTINITFSYEDLKNYKFFQAKEDSSLVKVMRDITNDDAEIMADPDDGSKFFRNGWLILDKRIDNTEFHHAMQYTYIVYED